MIRQRHRVTAGFHLAADLLAISLAFFAAWVLRFELQVVPLVKDLPDFGRYLAALPVVLVVWPIVFYFHGLYDQRRGRSRVDETLTVLFATLLATLLVSGLSAWYRPLRAPGDIEYFTYSRPFFALFAGLCLVFVVVGRVTLRALLKVIRLSGYNLQRILIVGAGALGKEIAAKLQAHRELGFEVVGFLDDDPGKANRAFNGVPVLGTLRQVDQALEDHNVDQVYVALPVEAHNKTLRILEAVGKHSVMVKLVPDVLQYAALKATLEDVDGTPVINLSQVPLEGWNSLIKRAMDFAVAGVLIVFPGCFVLPLLALAIWLEDGGPIFYRQERMGLDGRSFMMLKFRSMRVNAEASTGPVWAIRNDPRRTRIGELLRRWSLDELPQLWNVLVGDMSIVGPRPERPTFVHEFKHKVPQYMLRHRVKSGITGWAQVHGWRGNTSIRKRIQYDLYYIENWSILLDVKILWMTLRHGMKLNAY